MFFSCQTIVVTKPLFFFFKKKNRPTRKLTTTTPKKKKISPKDVSELKSVLATANSHRIPLWTFSRGKNLGYGGPAPRVNGSVALDLHRMDKILEVNDEFHYAVVEPGVTWSQLYDYCVANKKKVWPSTPSLGWGSVVGNVRIPPPPPLPIFPPQTNNPPQRL